LIEEGRRINKIKLKFLRTVINVCFKSRDIPRKYFKSFDYAITIIRKAASYDLATDADE